MSAEIKCEDVRDLFTPWLDGEISGEENDLLAGHLLTCEPCRNEFELWKRIADTLRDDTAIEEPSPDFRTGVMRRLQTETEVESRPRRRLAHIWRTPAAAAAAAVLLFAGSWGVSVALKPEKPEIIAIGVPDKARENTPKVQDPGTAPEKTAQPQDTIKPVEPVTESGGGQSGEPGVKTGQPALPETPKPGEPVKSYALLTYSQKDVLSTILKLSVPNTEDAKNIALVLTAKQGGSGQVLDSQKKGAGELTILRMTVTREGGRNLVAQLSGLGGVIDRIDEKRDISDNYNQAVNRLADIQARMKSGIPADEKSQLEAEASGLKRQIESWDKEASSYVIILWLEH